MKEMLTELIKAWKQYVRYCLYSRRNRVQRGIIYRRVVAMLFLISFGLLSVILITNSIAYGQEEFALGIVNYAPTLFRIFPFVTVGGSLTAAFVHFARKKFEFFKRMFDLVVVSTSLILLSPLFLIIAILLKLDSPGPVFFLQDRLGRNKTIFKMWKFRTMRDNAEMETGPVWAAEEDPRVTGLGRFLRNSHLDELPQLFNVFKGEMSLIGPRPERPEFRKIINGQIGDFDKRLDVRPGITGLAQVRYTYGASIKDAARKLKYDLLYIKNMRWSLDFVIIFWTFGRILTGEGAR